jgi:predicted MFS family arabinose efflux permease
MKDENESLKIKNINESNQNKEEEENNLINNSNNINTIDIKDFNSVDEFQKIEINKIIRSKYSSQLLSLTEGLLDFSHLAISYYFKDSLKLSPSQSSFYRSLISFPSIFQPLFGLISDLCPIMGYKRRTYLIIGGGLNFLLWSIISFISSSQFFAIFFLVIISLNNTFINACSGGILVEVSKKLTHNDKKLERYNASLIYRNIGMVISSISRGFIIEYFGIKTTFFIAGGLSLFNVIAGIIYFEVKYDKKEENSYQALKVINEEDININHDKKMNFFSVLNKKNIFVPLILVLFFSSSPSYFESSFYFLTDMKSFNPTNFGYLTLFMTIAMTITSIIYKNNLKDKNKKKVIFWASIISFFSSCFFNVYLTFNLKSKLIVILSISLYVSIKNICPGPMRDIAFLSCPTGFEGSVQGLFGSASSFGKTISTFFGSILTSLFKVEKNDYSNFNLMIFVHNIISLLSLFGLLFIDDELLSLKGKKKIFNCKKESTHSIETDVEII